MPPTYAAIHGADGLIVAVGEHGRIVHYVREPGSVAAEPRPQMSPTTHNLKAVWVEHARSAWAVGSAGTVLNWDGARWQAIYLAAAHHQLTAVWGFPGLGVWIGGRDFLLYHHAKNHEGRFIVLGGTVRSLWGSGPIDLFVLLTNRQLWHITDQSASLRLTLPGDPDEEWSVVTGCGPKDPVYVLGLSGLMLVYDRRQWLEVDSGTTEIILSAAARGTHDLWVTTPSGLLRHWNGQRWRTAAASPLGALYGVVVGEGRIWTVGREGLVFQHRPDEQWEGP